MTNLQFGDHLRFPVQAFQINSIQNVVPIRFDTINEDWIVCEQKNATHMLIIADTSMRAGFGKTSYMMIEIGKCENIYLLADAIVD